VMLEDISTSLPVYLEPRIIIVVVIGWTVGGGSCAVIRQKSFAMSHVIFARIRGDTINCTSHK